MVVGKKYSSFFVLVEFFEEMKFSALRLIEAAPECLNFEDNYDFSLWNQKTEVEAQWGNETYPAHFIQFGENKKLMEEIIDDLGEGKISISDVPLLQIEKCHEKKGIKRLNKMELQGTSKNKVNYGSLLSEIKTKLKEKKIPEAPKSLPTETCNKSELDNVKRALSEKVALLLETEQSLYTLRNKYSVLKEKYRNVKDQLKLSKERADMTKIGENLHIPTDKLSLCRVCDYSKYVGDLLEVYFGREILANSVLKGLKKNNEKCVVLDKNVIDDMISHVVQKFTIPVTCVKAAIRQKLNTCHKRNKKQLDV